MMGKSWSAINSLMVAARKDRPPALKAVIVCDGSDDRYNDDVHYMGGAHDVRQLELAVLDVGLARAAARSGGGRRCVEGDVEGRASTTPISGSSNGPAHQARDDYWSATAVRDHYGDVGVPVFIMSGWQDGYKNPVEHVVTGLTAARQAGRRADRRLGPQISVQRLSGPARRLAELHRHPLVGPLAQGQDPAARRRMAAAPGLARRVQGAEQIDLRRRDRQMGGRGRLSGSRASRRRSSISGRTSGSARSPRPRDARELRQAGARHRDARDELMGRMRQ